MRTFLRRCALANALAFTFGLWLSGGRAEEPDLAAELPRIKPLSPKKALASFRVHPGFHLETAAAEPIVSDPVSACYDADGRLYVVGMSDYPFPEDRPRGHVHLAKDSDGDGVFEKSTTFLDGLSWPTGVVPYDGGVFIAAAPDLLYAKDTDGDGKADVKEVKFTGFGTQNVQALMNGLLWGPDGWIYGVSGGNGGEIRNGTHPEKIHVSLRGRDFRFRPDGSAFEAISGGGQFGHSFDDWGHRFTCNNSNHIRQIVLPSRYLERNSSLSVPAVLTDIAAEGPAAPVYRLSEPEPWRVVRTRQRVADPAMVARLPITERVASGYFTSATGVTIYRGTAFPPEFRGNAFIGDVGGNLVHRKVLSESGETFLATRGDPESKTEFLASPDNWFRPVNFANTPDGTLLILDMYRETIEHPLSIPDPIKAHLDLTSGRNHGRLYNLVPDGFTDRRHPHLSRVGTSELVSHLADPDAWWRETAQRLLIERRDSSAVPLLRALARDRPTPLGRLHALWTMAVLGRLTPDELLPALSDPEPRVREQAARLAEGLAAMNPEVAEGLLALAGDANAMVRLQAAFSLGEIPDRRAVEALAAIASRDRSSPWVRAAVLSSIAGRLPAFFEALRKSPGFVSGAEAREWFGEIAVLAGAAGRSEERAAILVTITAPDVDHALARAVAIGLDRGMKQSGGSLRSSLDPQAWKELAPLFATARADAESESLAVSRRSEAIQIVGLGPIDEALEILPPLLDIRQKIEIQLASLRALSGLPDRRVGPEVIARWKALSPSVRREAAEVLLAKPERLNALLDAIETHELPAGELDPTRRKQILSHTDPKIRVRSAKLFGEIGIDRGRALAEARGALALAGDRERGGAVFRKTCATCHQNDRGKESAGPDLATVAGRTPEDLLIHILDPNREVQPQYIDYRVATSDGRIYTGRIASETGEFVTLTRGEGLIDVLPRARIEAISSGGVSLMPEGLEKSLTNQDMADVIAYLRELGKSPTPER